MVGVLSVAAGLSLFNHKQFKGRPKPFESATLSDFSGGLDVVDNDVTMKSKYAKVLTNWNRGLDGSQSVRWGTKYFCNVTGTVTGTIIETIYFNRHILAITSTGQICKITGEGVKTVIWNTAIAAALVGAPSGWSTGLSIGIISHAEFRGELIICNGIDKPLIVKKTMAVEYLNDPATGSNINTPIARFVTTVGNYMVMAGVTGDEDSIYISNQGTSGVWFGDPAPNDAVTIGIGTYVPENSGDILGLGSFRNFLIVAFEGAIVVVALGSHNASGDHEPAIQDNIVEHGIISNRTTMTTKNDFVMADVLGWHSAYRTQFGALDTQTLSKIIDPAFIAEVPADNADRSFCFSVRNPLEGRWMTFMPGATGPVVWAMSSSDQSEIKNTSWSKYTGMDWDCGCVSERGRVFFAKDTKIFQYGNAVYTDEDYTADRLGDFNSNWTTTTHYVVGDLVLFTDGKSYKALVNHTAGVFASDLASVYWEEYMGEAIEFDWELPWVDINQRAKKKFLKFIQADTSGKATFTIDIFFDNYYKDQDGNYDPALSMQFVAGDADGYGAPGDLPYGGGRRLRDERPWGTPGEFKIMKLRFHGSTRAKLSMVTLTILYWLGSYRR